MATLDDLRNAVEAEFSGRLLGGNPVLEKSNFSVMAGFIGFLQFANERGLDAVSDRLTPVSAVGDLLDQWGQTFGVTRLDETPAIGLVTLSGSLGATLPSGSILTRCDGFEYRTVGDTTITAGTTASATVEAATSGADGNFLSGGQLTVGSVTAGVTGTAISQGIVSGADIECDDAYRTRILATIRNPCRTGTEQDYDFWARLYPGVTRVCVRRNFRGPGTVGVYVLMDGSYPNGIPTGADVAAIQDIIFGAGGLAPLGIVGTVLPPDLQPIDVSITGVGGVTPAVFATVRDALNDFFLDLSGCDGAVICRADMEIAIRSVLDDCFTLSAPSANVNIAAGSVATIGALTVA